jgi:general secretion pathway protein A
MDIQEHFGLSGNAFSATPDPRFAFETREHRLAMLKIVFSVQERMGLFLLQGDAGMGKTTLSRFLLKGWLSDGDNYAVAHLTDPSMRTQAGFLRKVVEEFGLLPSRNLGTLKDTLLAFLTANHQAGKTSILLIDEAQQTALPNLDLLHLLSNHSTASQQLLQVVLLGQLNFAKKLEQRPALRSRITGGAYLNPLTLEDSVDMLRHRVGVVGGDFERIFPVSTHVALYKAGRGIPRDLCVLCRAAMINAGPGIGGGGRARNPRSD